MASTPKTTTPSIASAIVQSRDGTPISYQTIGNGPALIIIPGALSLAEDFHPLAQALSDAMTVHVIERRGRGRSGEMGTDYSIGKECEDVGAVQARTGAPFIFGHSFGGLIAVEAARHNPSFRKVAVYEPGISINHSVSLAWIPAYQAHLAANKPLDAFVDFVRESGPSYLKRLPRWWLKFVMPKVVHGEEWAKIVKLLPHNLIEHQEVGRLDNTYPNYRAVAAEVLLMAGGKSPKFRENTLHTLAGVFPKSEVIILPGLDHFGPTTGAPMEVAAALKRHFIG